MAAKITKIGPVIVVEDDSEEYIATFQVCYNQAGRSSSRDHHLGDRRRGQDLSTLWDEGTPQAGPTSHSDRLGR